MHGTPQNKLHVLMAQINELNTEMDTLDTEYAKKRKGSKYHRQYDTLNIRVNGLKQQVLKMGGTYNIVRVVARVKGKHSTMFLTNISIQDAKDLIKLVDPTIQIDTIREMAPKKWFTLG